MCHADTIPGCVGLDPVGQQSVPDEQIAGLQRDKLDGETGGVRPDRIAVRRLRGHPGLERAEQLRNALETADFRIGIDQREHTLDVDG